MGQGKAGEVGRMGLWAGQPREKGGARTWHFRLDPNPHLSSLGVAGVYQVKGK